MLAIDRTMTANSSARDIVAHQDRTISGASTTPRKMLAPALSPTTPVTPNVRRRIHDSPFTTHRNTPQCQNSAVKAEKTMMSGRIWNAITVGGSTPGLSAKGSAAPPR